MLKSVLTGVTIVATAFIASGCVTPTGGRTGEVYGGGKTIRWTKWETVTATDVVVNIADYPGDFPKSNIRQRVRDNQYLQQEIDFVGRRGEGIDIRYLSPAGHTIIYNHGQRYSTESKVRNLANKYFAKSRKAVHFQRLVKVAKYGKHSGYAAQVTLTPFDGGESRDCIIAGLNFLSKGKTHHATDERFDSNIRLMDCTGNRTVDQIAAWLRSADIVPRGYNRI